MEQITAVALSSQDCDSLHYSACDEIQRLKNFIHYHSVFYLLLGSTKCLI